MAFARPGHGLRHVPGVPFRLFERLRVRARRVIDLINQTRDQACFELGQCRVPCRAAAPSRQATP